ncbi:MAG: PDZ domain-containing protein [Planctomycetes bacterium]|nr:PDZ domain-containing protein [Planctomycetota bacterium]
MLRIGNLRGIDLSWFEVDFDLTWNALFLAPEGQTLGRFGGRDAHTPQKYHSLPALNLALRQALKRFRAGEVPKPAPRKPERAENYPAAAKLPFNACIHCHHVHEFRRDALQRARRWSLDDVWIYPQPENVGLTLDINQGDRVLSVKSKSPAAILGITPKDVLRKIGGVPIASIADVQYALNQAPTTGEIRVEWQRNGVRKGGDLNLPKDWRKTDVSWRWSLKSLSPNPSLIGDDLEPAERAKLGLTPKRLAYRQMNFLTPTARHAGLRANDVIIGINDRPLTMTARQFETHIRLYHRVGEEITLNVLRGKESVRVKLKLPE